MLKTTKQNIDTHLQIVHLKFCIDPPPKNSSNI